jgi:hypothetical protein
VTLPRIDSNTFRINVNDLLAVLVKALLHSTRCFDMMSYRAGRKQIKEKYSDLSRMETVIT